MQEVGKEHLCLSLTVCQGVTFEMMQGVIDVSEHHSKQAPTAEQVSQLTLKVANASEAMSNVDISTYLKKS